MSNKPKHFLVCKILGFILLAVAIAGFVLSFTHFGKFESDNNWFIIGNIVSGFSLVIAFFLLSIGFMPNIARGYTKATKYIQDANKDTLSDIASTQADIIEKGLEKSAKTIKNTLSKTKICSECGAKITSDAKFCSKCGKPQQ